MCKVTLCPAPFVLPSLAACPLHVYSSPPCLLSGDTQLYAECKLLPMLLAPFGPWGAYSKWETGWDASSLILSLGGHLKVADTRRLSPSKLQHLPPS